MSEQVMAEKNTVRIVGEWLAKFGEDGSGLFMKYLRRGSGYYIDVGASQLIHLG